MDGQKCIEETKAHFCSFLSRNATKSGRVKVYCWCLVLHRDRSSYVECVTVQNIKCTDSVQCATELY